jgi:hypothetical protein
MIFVIAMEALLHGNPRAEQLETITVQVDKVCIFGASNQGDARVWSAQDHVS